jgi:hypothetical protein
LSTPRVIIAAVATAALAGAGATAAYLAGTGGASSPPPWPPCSAGTSPCITPAGHLITGRVVIVPPGGGTYTHGSDTLTISTP